MKKFGLLAAAIFAGSLSLSDGTLAAQGISHRAAYSQTGHVRRSEGWRVNDANGIYHEDRLPNGTLTGPLPSDNPNG